MPTIRVELFEGRSPEQKRLLVQALTDAAVSTLGGSPDSVDVLIHEVARHHWATGGRLWSERESSGAALGPGPAGDASASGGQGGRSLDDSPVG